MNFVHYLCQIHFLSKLKINAFSHKGSKNTHCLFNLYQFFIQSVQLCRCIKEFLNSLEGSAKIHLLEDKTHSKSKYPWSSGCAGNWEPNRADKRACAHFSSALRVPQPMPQMASIQNAILAEGIPTIKLFIYLHKICGRQSNAQNLHTRWGLRILIPS